jgi:hypothetical protein
MAEGNSFKKLKYRIWHNMEFLKLKTLVHIYRRHGSLVFTLKRKNLACRWWQEPEWSRGEGEVRHLWG